MESGIEKVTNRESDINVASLTARAFYFFSMAGSEGRIGTQYIECTCSTDILTLSIPTYTHVEIYVLL